VCRRRVGRRGGSEVTIREQLEGTYRWDGTAVLIMYD